VVIRADMAPVRIGPRSNVQDNSVIHTDEGAPTLIGADCTVGHAAIVHGATVGDGSLIGMVARLLNHAKVGKGCIVAAGALLAEGKAVPDGQLAMGAPAKTARAISDAERQRIREGVEHYRTYAKEYRANIASAARREPGHSGVREL
jgi:carbonic anhydrase/acetyltransferase-like protein (isoleucine patch superfamily)